MRKRQPSLADIVRDMPDAPVDPHRERLARYLQDLDSLAPPSDTADRIGELRDQGKLSQSGSYVVQDVLEATRDAFQRQALAAMMREKELADLKAERDEAKRKLDADARSREDRKNGIIIGTVVGVVVPLILGLLALAVHSVK